MRLHWKASFPSKKKQATGVRTEWATISAEKHMPYDKSAQTRKSSYLIEEQVSWILTVSPLCVCWSSIFLWDFSTQVAHLFSNSSREFDSIFPEIVRQEFSSKYNSVKRSLLKNSTASPCWHRNHLLGCVFSWGDTLSISKCFIYMNMGIRKQISFVFFPNHPIRERNPWDRVGLSLIS